VLHGHEAFSFNDLITSLNQGVIKLILKNASWDTIGGLRPTTLLRRFCLMSLLFECEELLRELVGRSRQDLSRGRFILDIVIFAWEARKWAKEVGHDSLFHKSTLIRHMVGLIRPILWRCFSALGLVLIVLP
jgi:hypothetical protein